MVTLAELAPPRTAAVTAATEVARRFASPWLYNHARRSYLWGAAYAAEQQIDYDQELYYVAAILHDLGLEEPFDSHRLPLEEASGQVAWVLAAGLGWPVSRRDRVAEIIVQHMRDTVAVNDDPESHLLQLATSFDISGRDCHLWTVDLRSTVLRDVPRGTLTDDFLAHLHVQAERKPDSAAAAELRSGLADRALRNPLDSRTPDDSRDAAI